VKEQTNTAKAKAAPKEVPKDTQPIFS